MPTSAPEADHLIMVGPGGGMRILDCATRETLATAAATGCCGAYTWTIHAAGFKDETTTNRAHAIGIMVDHAIASTGGFTTLVPRGNEQPIGEQ